MNIRPYYPVRYFCSLQSHLEVCSENVFHGSSSELYLIQCCGIKQKESLLYLKRQGNCFSMNYVVSSLNLRVEEKEEKLKVVKNLRHNNFDQWNCSTSLYRFRNMIIRRLALLLCPVERLHRNFITRSIQLLWALLKISTVYLKFRLYALCQVAHLQPLPSSQSHTSSGMVYILAIVHSLCFRSKEGIGLYRFIYKK